MAAPTLMASMFAVTHRCGSMTPLGSAVLPLVNCKIANESGSTVGIENAALDAPRASSSKVVVGTSGGTKSASAGSINTIAGSALAIRRRVESTNSSIEPSRIGSGSIARVAPASQVA